MAIPARSLDLGQTDNGTQAKGTQTRTSYDALAAGFGPGLNGPLLVAVDLAKPAKNDQAQLQKVTQQQAQQQQAVAAGQAPPPTQQQHDQAAQQKQFLSSTASDPRLQ